jgi:hypothetical protein
VTAARSYPPTVQPHVRRVQLDAVTLQAVLAWRDAVRVPDVLEREDVRYRPIADAGLHSLKITRARKAVRTARADAESLFRGEP